LFRHAEGERVPAGEGRRLGGPASAGEEQAHGEQDDSDRDGKAAHGLKESRQRRRRRGRVEIGYPPAAGRDSLGAMTTLTRHRELLILCARIGYTPPAG
jgi:hypothetical protein